METREVAAGGQSLVTVTLSPGSPCLWLHGHSNRNLNRCRCTAKLSVASGFVKLAASYMYLSRSGFLSSILERRLLREKTSTIQGIPCASGGCPLDVLGFSPLSPPPFSSSDSLPCRRRRSLSSAVKVPSSLSRQCSCRIRWLLSFFSSRRAGVCSDVSCHELLFAEEKGIDGKQKNEQLLVSSRFTYLSKAVLLP